MNRRAAEWRVAILYILRADLARFVQELDCHVVSTRDATGFEQFLLRGGYDTQGCSTLKESEIDDRRNRLPLS